MYGSKTESENFIILDIYNVLMMYIYGVWAQSRRSKSSIWVVMSWETIFLKLLNNAHKKCKKNSKVNHLVVEEQVEKIEINAYHQKSCSVMDFCNVSLFTKIFCRFPGIFIEEFEEIWEQIHKE